MTIIIGTPATGVASTDLTLIQDLESTLLPLDYFRRILGVDPYHFWQFEHPDHPMSTCTSIYSHEKWQSGNVARLDMLLAIVEAERNLAEVIRYWPAPRYQYRERRPLQHPQVLSSRSIRPLTLRTEYIKIRDVGTPQWDFLESISLAYDATDDIAFTVAVPEDATAEEIVVVYHGSRVKIRPIVVTIADAVATISIKKWLLGNRLLWEQGDNINAANIDNFEASVDVYHVWLSKTKQILTYWEPADTSHTLCSDETCPICEGCTQNACAMGGNYDLGVVSYQYAEYDAAYTKKYPIQNRYPDYGYISYISGADTQGDRYMSRFWQRIVAHYAVALLDMPLCSCSDVRDNYNYWQEDFGQTQGVAGRSTTYSQSALENPLGSLRRGAIEAWNTIRRMVEM
jgi:hypothetical protein